MKGIILAGGKATRLYPVTKEICKQMLPVYDKPMIYYPLSALMLAGIKDILIISTPKGIGGFKNLLGDGKGIGIKLSYAVQKEPRGIAEAFIIGEDFIGKDSVCLILGDNILFGHNLTKVLKKATALKKGAVVFGYYVKDPCRYGVLEFDKNKKVRSISEKPKEPKSNWVVTGLYFYDNEVTRIAHSLKPSARGELEVTDINKVYLKKKKLSIKFLGRGYAWLDTGTHDALIDASLYVRAIEDRQGLKVGCIEEIAYKMGFIDRAQLRRLSQLSEKNYGGYLNRVLEDGQ